MTIRLVGRQQLQGTDPQSPIIATILAQVRSPNFGPSKPNSMDHKEDPFILPVDDQPAEPQTDDDDDSVQLVSSVSVHDVLSGRGINIAQHAGNERFRALVNSRYDVNYCSSYTLMEKRAVAEDIIAHIKALDPPGRFLKRASKSKAPVRALEGPWEELTKEEAIKKTCQALRDCNRQDRVGYAAAVAVPEDVQYYTQLRTETGLTKRELAQQVAAQVVANRQAAQIQSSAQFPVEALLGKRERGDSESADFEPVPIAESQSLLGHSSDWVSQHSLKKSRTAGMQTPAPNMTPATVASSGIMSGGTGNTSVSHADSVDPAGHLPDSGGYLESGGDQHLHHSYYYPTSGYSPVVATAASLMEAHGLAPLGGEASDHTAFEDPFEIDAKQAAIDNHDFVDPLHLTQMDSSNNSEGDHYHSSHLQDFGPPSPLGVHHDDDPLNDHHHNDPF